MQKILVLAANPKNTSPLRLNEELREIKEGMRQAGERQQFLIESAEAVRTRDIHRSILNVKPNIIHFSGHGSGEQGLVFEDETGNAKLVDAAALARLFKLFASDVKCIVLNACYSETQAEAIAQHIDYVIGMSQAIGDKAAIEFTVGFYDALGAGRSIEFAYELGCSVIQIAGISESLTPKLLTKKQLNLQPSNQTLPSFSESDGSGQRVTVYKPPFPSDNLSSDRGGDYTQPEIVQSPQTDDLSSDRNEQEAQRVQQYENNLRRYEQQLSQALKAGYPLDEFVRNGLKKFQQSLEIRDEDVVPIEQRLLTPKQAEYERQQEAIKQEQEAQRVQRQREKLEYENNLRRYEQELSVALKAGYPLDEFVRNRFKEFQQSKGISDEDVKRIEQPVLAEAEAKYQEKLQTEAAERQRQLKLLELEAETQRQSERQQQQEKKSIRGDDLRLDLKLSFQEAAFGTDKEIRISHLENCNACKDNSSQRNLWNKCSVCNGEELVQVTKLLKISIPAGVDNGTRLRISQEGDAGRNGGTAGDLYVYLFFDQDDELTRSNEDILSSLVITTSQAATGCQMDIPTIDGSVCLTIPPGTKDGATLRLRNRGVPRLGNPSIRGNHLVTILVREFGVDQNDLSSDHNVDYTRLRDLLKAGNWKDADYETYLVMLKAVGRKGGDWIRDEELLNFPCTDLRTIDSLWVKYSNGRFGFSVQKKIYLEVGGIPDGEYHEEAWKKFGDHVGWRKGWWMNKEWINFNEVVFDTSAPRGHLPRAWAWEYLLKPAGVLFSRIETCKL